MKHPYRKTKIKISILLTPDKMDGRWKVHLREAVDKLLLGKCTVEHGFIVKIIRIRHIIDQIVTRIDGNIRFHLMVDVHIIRPRIGDEMDATIDMIFSHGIFCYHRMLRMILPISKCHPYVLRQDFSNLYLFHPITHHIIRINDTIRVVISDVRFENNLYSCVVHLKI